jgi:hypothetical protein
MYELCMNFVWTLYELCMNFVWTLYELCMNFVWTSHELLMNFSWTSHELLMNFSWTSHELLTNFSWTSHELLMNFSWTSHELVKNSYKLLMNILWISSKVLIELLSDVILYNVLWGRVPYSERDRYISGLILVVKEPLQNFNCHRHFLKTSLKYFLNLCRHLSAMSYIWEWSQDPTWTLSGHHEVLHLVRLLPQSQT